MHLVLPKRQLFEEEAEQPSASVMIGVGGREPSADQVRAIQNLVAGAVPNLKPDRVTVVDQHGKTLAGGDDRHRPPRPTAARARSSSASPSR